MAVIGVNVIQAPAIILLELDVASVTMHRARAVTQSAHPQKQRLTDHDRATRASCKIIVASEDPVHSVLPLMDRT